MCYTICASTIARNNGQEVPDFLLCQLSCRKQNVINSKPTCAISHPFTTRKTQLYKWLITNKTSLYYKFVDNKRGEGFSIQEHMLDQYIHTQNGEYVPKWDRNATNNYWANIFASLQSIHYISQIIITKFSYLSIFLHRDGSKEMALDCIGGSYHMKYPQPWNTAAI